MIKGCSSHGCAVTGEAPGMHTNSICNCVRAASKAESILNSRSWIEIDGRIVGPQTTRGNEIYIIRNWLKGGGLRDILAMERKDDSKPRHYSACGGCSPEGTSDWADCETCHHNPNKEVEG